MLSFSGLEWLSSFDETSALTFLDSVREASKMQNLNFLTSAYGRNEEFLRLLGHEERQPSSLLFDPLISGYSARRSSYTAEQLTKAVEFHWTQRQTATLACRGNKVQVFGEIAVKSEIVSDYEDVVAARGDTWDMLRGAIEEIGRTHPVFESLAAVGNSVVLLDYSDEGGSSSFSNAPGLAVLRTRQPHVGNGLTSRDTVDQINGIVHEATHGVLFLLESAIDQQLVVEPTDRQVTSPWSGNRLGVYQFIQALFVWYVLARFWSSYPISDVSTEFLRRAVYGFARRGGAAAEVLESVRQYIHHDVLPVARDACEAVQ